MKSIRLQHISLTNFKNFEEEVIEIDANTIAVVGHNGMGKTNLLDAIYFLCMAKSYFSIPDKSIVRHGTDFFRLEGIFEIDDEKNRVVVKVASNRNKVVEWNETPYSLLSEHIGRLPVVMICPRDNDIIIGQSTHRRKFLDRSICQTDRRYLEKLGKYKRILKQRNALLKRIGGNSVNHSLLDSYDELMIEPANYINKTRNTFIDEIKGLYKDNLSKISSGNEKVELEFVSKMNDEDYSNLLLESRDRDLILQRTTCGPHKDDLSFTYESLPFRKHASQGQIKSTLLALKFAQAVYLREKTESNPIILIDDIFDKLDNQRVDHLLNLLWNLGFPQIFISDAHETRFEDSIQNKEQKVSRYWVENGTIEAT